jgi:hypothetical protein
MIISLLQGYVSHWHVLTSREYVSPPPPKLWVVDALVSSGFKI